MAKGNSQLVRVWRAYKAAARGDDAWRGGKYELAAREWTAALEADCFGSAGVAGSGVHARAGGDSQSSNLSTREGKPRTPLSNRITRFQSTASPLYCL